MPILAFLLLAVAAPARADGPPPHSGIVDHHSGPELSDFALFGMAAVGVVLARRAMAKRRSRKD